jgi:hypothetical protein
LLKYAGTPLSPAAVMVVMHRRRNTLESGRLYVSESQPCDSSSEPSNGARIHIPSGAIEMLMIRERRPTNQTLRGWAISVLQEAGAIRECEHHGWMQDRADPHARERAFDIARRDPAPGTSAQAAAVAIAEVLDSIGDTCPECPPEAG